MQWVISSCQDFLLYAQGRPFTTSVKILLGVVAAATAVTIPHSGFIWTAIFAAFSVFCGAATFLLIVDDQNGGILSELRRLIHYLQLPYLESFLELFPRPSVDLERPTSSAAPPTDGPSPTLTLSSRSLERIYPWLNLTLPKLLDDSLSNLLEIIINDYMTKDWYALVQVRKNFVNEVRVALRYGVSKLVRKLHAVNCTAFIHRRVSRAFVEHISVFLSLRKLAASSGESDLEVLLKTHPELSHQAMKESSGEEEEDLFFYRISTQILSRLLPREFRHFQASAAVLREVLTELVLKNVVDAFSEPYRISYLFSLALSQPAAATDPPAVPPADLGEVAILRKLVSEEKPTSTVQKMTFRQMQKETTLKNSFEQHLKSLNLEEFCKVHESISWINKFLDSPVLGETAIMSTYNSLLKLHKEVQLAQTKGYSFPADFLADINAIAVAGPSSIPKLRQLPSWKKMNDALITLFENLLVPSFQETRLYHHLTMPPTEEVFRKRVLQRGTSRQRPSPHPEALRLLSQTVRGVLKEVPPVVDRPDGETYEEYEESSDLPDDDFDDLDSELPASAKNEDALGSTLRDLTCYDISVLRAERRRDDRGRIFMILNITVFDHGPRSPDMNKRWAVQRKYAEFYILDSKIRQFHGQLEASAFLPAKKAWTQPSLEFLQQRVQDFEKFLQLLVREPKLRYSQMLYNFLATTMEFDSSGFPDLGLGKVIRNVPQILTQERGQNIESFVRSLLNTALPAKAKPLTEMAAAKDDPSPPYHPPPTRKRLESLSFEPPVTQEDTHDFTAFQSVFDEMMYLGTTLLNLDQETLTAAACCHTFAVPYVEAIFQRKIGEFVEYFKDPAQMAYLLDILSQTLTCAYPQINQAMIDAGRQETLEKFLVIARTLWPDVVCGGVGRAEHVARLFLDLFQYKVLNKRLVMILLDLTVVELFPELAAGLAVPSSP